MPVSHEDILDVLVEHLCAVMAVSPDRILPDTRLSDDLHADSPERAEVLERVEQALRRRGISVHVPEGEPVDLRTVQEAAERIWFPALGVRG